MANPITLYSFAVSHYAEKVRWAMDYSDIYYREVSWVPIFHTISAYLKSGKRTVPFIETELGVVHDSTEILLWLEKNRKPFNLMPSNKVDRQAALDIESLVDSVGFDIIRYMYITLINYPDDFVEVWGWDAKPAERIILKKSIPMIKRILSLYLGFSKTDQLNGNERIAKVFKQLDERISDGRNFLVGDSLTIADISAASILAPVLMPDNHSLYSSDYFCSELASQARQFEVYDSYQWLLSIYKSFRFMK